MKHRLAFLAAALIAAGLGVVSACSSFDEEPTPVTEAGAAEGGDGGGEAGGRFCATVDASFCADFDVGGIDGGGWDSIDVLRGAMNLVPSDRSSPNAFQGVIQTGDAGAPDAEVPENAAGAALGRRLGRNGVASTVATLDFDVRIDSVSPSKALSFVAGLGFDARSATSEFASVYLNEGQLVVIVENDPAGRREASKLPVQTPAAGTWFHLTIEITFGVGTRVLLDGSAVFTSSVNLTDKSSDLLVAVGPYQTQAGVEARVSYDNVVVRDLK